MPRPRADASICDAGFKDKQRELTEQLRDCIRKGLVGAPWEGSFPRYVWGMIEGQVFEARLVNREQGEYKGYPLEQAAWPEGLPLGHE